MRKTKVLLLCTGNSARSQMAEAFVRKYAGDHFNVFSAGLEPGTVNPYTVRVMDEIGIDISDHVPQAIDDLHDMGFDRIVTFPPQAQQARRPAPERHHGVRVHRRVGQADVEQHPRP